MFTFLKHADENRTTGELFYLQQRLRLPWEGIEEVKAA